MIVIVMVWIYDSDIEYNDSDSEYMLIDYIFNIW